MSGAASQPPKANRSRPRASGVVVPHQPKWHQRIAAWLVVAAIRTVSLTLRYRWVNRAELFNGEPPGPAIYCVWHNRLALCLVAYRSYAQKRVTTAGIAGLVSASRDGGFLAGILEYFHVQPVRGSSSRRGAQALLELTSWAGRGYDLAITPDGPRGPRYVVQDGIMSLAQLTGLPIIPFSYNVDWKICANSWDRFIIPLPFARCDMNFDNPIRVPRDAGPAEREALRQRLESSLRAMSRD